MDYEISFILPCLNEEKTLIFCINEIKDYINKSKISAEILVSDNNSIDNSKKIAEENGARVVLTSEKGYGNALINGIKHAHGKYCIMGDADGSYDFSHLDDFIQGVRNGYDLVIGNRFLGGIEPGAMTLSHKIGVRLLSSFANMFFHTPFKDYHCGLRAFNKNSIEKLNLSCPGMEFASEQIIKAKLANLKLLEVSTILKKDLRNRKSHLNTIRDGCRHLILIIKLFMFRKKFILGDKYE